MIPKSSRTFQLEPPCPAARLLNISSALDIRLHIDDLLVVDKGRIESESSKPSETFKNPTPTTDEIGRALEVSSHENKTAQESYHLFHVVMSLSPAPGRRSGTPLASPRTAPTNGTNSCRGSRTLKTFSLSRTVTWTWPPKVVKTRVSPIRTCCVCWLRFRSRHH